MTTPLHPTPSPTQAHIRTPLGRVRGLGSAKEGTDHFWKQRITAVANTVLVAGLVALVVSLVGTGHAAVIRTIKNPLVGIALLMLILSGLIHMRLGMQTIIEDYVHREGAKVLLLMLNTFFAVAVGLACILSVLKISFGA